MNVPSEKFECFCVYGFCIDYPNGWRVGLDPNSEWKGGRVVFISPSQMKLFLSWQPLEKIKGKYSSINEHSENTISKIKKGSKAKNVKLVNLRSLSINSHQSLSCHIELELSSRFLTMLRGDISSIRNVCFIHTYCEHSQRHFSIYGSSGHDNPLQLTVLLEHMAKSLKCH